MTYAEKLKDPRWQRRRLELLEAAQWQCRHCTRKDKTLHVHHNFYRTRTSPWDYPDHAYVVLCEDCHNVAEIERRSLQQAIETVYEAGTISVQLIVGFIKALRMQAHLPDDPSYSELLENRQQLWAFARAYQADERDLAPLLNNGEVHGEMLTSLWRKQAERLQNRLQSEPEETPVTSGGDRDLWPSVVDAMCRQFPLRSAWLELATKAEELDGELWVFFPENATKIVDSPSAKNVATKIEKLWLEWTGRPVVFVPQIEVGEIKV